MTNDQKIYHLFAPKSGRHLRVDYPELADYEEFRALSQRELLFVWYYACKSSPFFSYDIEDERDVVLRCLEYVKIAQEPEKREAYLSRNFPEKIQAAIDMMHKFEPSIRIMARFSAIKALEDVRKLTSLELDENGNHSQFLNKDGEIDFEKRNKYMQAIMKAQDNIPELIRKAEKGYSVAEKTTLSNKHFDFGEKTFMESYHENN